MSEEERTDPATAQENPVHRDVARGNPLLALDLARRIIDATLASEEVEGHAAEDELREALPHIEAAEADIKRGRDEALMDEVDDE